MQATVRTRSGSLAARLRCCRTARATQLSLVAAGQQHVDGKHRFPLLRRAISDAHMLGAVPATNATPASFRSPRVLNEAEEVVTECSDGGTGNGKSSGGGRCGGMGAGGGQRMGEYYRRALRSEPASPLLLRNYGKYLHDVEGDLAGAEECYGRAVLSSPEDGELLSLYAGVVWEARREKERANAYFERAVEAAPDDCYVLGSYATFLWDAEEEEDAAAASSALVSAC